MAGIAACLGLPLPASVGNVAAELVAAARAKFRKSSLPSFAPGRAQAAGRGCGLSGPPHQTPRWLRRGCRSPALLAGCFPGEKHNSSILCSARRIAQRCRCVHRHDGAAFWMRGLHERHWESQTLKSSFHFNFTHRLLEDEAFSGDRSVEARWRHTTAAISDHADV